MLAWDVIIRRATRFSLLTLLCSGGVGISVLVQIASPKRVRESSIAVAQTGR
jgi:hypothetical protein